MNALLLCVIVYALPQSHEARGQSGAGLVREVLRVDIADAEDFGLFEQSLVFLSSPVLFSIYGGNLWTRQRILAGAMLDLFRGTFVRIVVLCRYLLGTPSILLETPSELVENLVLKVVGI